jgi:hypothetical protein
MKGRLLGLAAILLAASVARADSVTLRGGRVIHGDAVTIEGDEVVVSSKHGSTRFPREKVEEIHCAPPRGEPTTEAEKFLAKLAEAEKKKPDPVAKADALTWEKDEKKALELATAEKKIVLTFSVVGELGTGHC